MLIYDGGRHVIVCLTGQGPNGPLDTWDLDGTTFIWTNRLPSPNPKPWPRGRSSFGATYDPIHARIYLFGGADAGGGYYDDLWEWDGNAGNWTSRTPATLPTAWPDNRYGSAFAFDADRGKIVMFGGEGLDWSTGGLAQYADLWEWDPSTLTWTDRTPNPLPESWPRARQFATMVYDPGRKYTVLFGGDTAGSVSGVEATVAEVWEWDGIVGTFTNRTPSPLPASWPAARSGHAMAYDSSLDRTMLFGGVYTSPDFWAWDGATGTWADLTLSPLPARWPGIRLDAGMAYDSATDRLVLYGGHTNAFLNDLWWWAPGVDASGGADGGVDGGIGDALR